MPAVVSCCAAGGLAHRLGDAEIGHQRVPSGEQHVVGLDVAVDHALRVRVGERVGDLGEEPHRLVDRQLALAGRAARGAFSPSTNGMT